MPDRVTLRHVARRPFTGAWIETLDIALADRAISVAPSRGRGLKPVAVSALGPQLGSPLHGGVD